MRHGNHKFVLLILLFITFVSKADPIEGNSVRLQILDKITSQIETINLPVNDNYEYGSLRIEVYACYKRPPEEIPEDFVLLRVFDILDEDNPQKIFQGWMISSSPEVAPFEHSIFDLWVKRCITD